VSERLREIADRLGTIARQLAGDEVDDAQAADLAHEAAELSAEAVEETNRRARESDG
jgi:uncharacterized membrane-anchored protein